MKTMAFAALAALLAVAPTAVARAGSDQASPEPVARPGADVLALLDTMDANARVAREVLGLARSHKRADEVRCSDEALSRADVALRRAREDFQALTAALTARDDKAAETAMHSLKAHAAASHDAAGIAKGCLAPASGKKTNDRTQVTVQK
jgi:hypothetical protein